MNPLPLQLLLLEVGDGVYGVESAAVREIVAGALVTRLPGAPAHIRGVMNLRGQLVTVLDLVQRLTGAPAPRTDGSTIVVQSGERLLGLVVDDVRDVQTVDVTDAVRGDTIPLGEAAHGLIRGLGRLEDAIVILLDVDELVRQTLA
ncbi:MAG TPA: chemotaxis protein CheW [Gemmatimonadaceae bacterium]|nr:chemotaxis protein CheW [Gemmatimonadaceae bacterium]